MSGVHSIFKDVVGRKVSEVQMLPWLGENPLGYWDKNGEEFIEFSVLANVVSGGGVHVGASTAKAMNIEGEQSIVPLKERKINTQTGERRSAWKYVKAVKFNSFFNEAPEGPDRYAELVAKFDLTEPTDDLDAFNQLYFLFLHKLGCTKPLAIESFMAEVASAYALLKHGIRVPKAYLSTQRMADWLTILRDRSEESVRTLTNICVRADSLIR